MDVQISLLTPAMHRARGAKAFDDGHGIDEHNMNPGAAAIADWQAGWRQRQAESRRSVQQLVGSNPP